MRPFHSRRDLPRASPHTRSRGRLCARRVRQLHRQYPGFPRPPPRRPPLRPPRRPPAPLPLVPDAARYLTGTAAQFQASCRQDIQKARDAIFPLQGAARASGHRRGAGDLRRGRGPALQRRRARGHRHQLAPGRGHAHRLPGLRDGGGEGPTEIGLDRGVYDVLSSLDLSQQDAATKQYVEPPAARLPPRRRGPGRGHPRQGAARSRRSSPGSARSSAGTSARTCAAWSCDPKELAGLPEDYVRAHPPGANGKVRITTDYPDYTPFMAYAQERQGPRGALARLPPARLPEEPGRRSRACSPSATSWPRCWATRTGPPTPPRTR